jgi:hypothetical protein
MNYLKNLTFNIHVLALIGMIFLYPFTHNDIARYAFGTCFTLMIITSLSNLLK